MEVGGQDPYQDIDEEKQDEKVQSSSSDVFGDEEHAEVKYKVLSWWYVARHGSLFHLLMRSYRQCGFCEYLAISY